VYHPRTFFTSSYSGDLGYDYPFALGTKVARPDKAVVAACGDGGFMYNCQELDRGEGQDQRGLAVRQRLTQED
jgi:acetolactate synthase-1/2/3 large subunit